MLIKTINLNLNSNIEIHKLFFMQIVKQKHSDLNSNIEIHKFTTSVPGINSDTKFKF